MVDLKNVKVDFPPNSAYAVLLGLVLNCGLDSVLLALAEIAAQQSVEPTRDGLGEFAKYLMPKQGGLPK